MTLVQNAREAVTESVWDYPRPPKLEPVFERLVVQVFGLKFADTSGGFRVLETSHPPTYYFPPDDVRIDLLSRATGRSVCEFKGEASYWNAHVKGRTAWDIAWSYADPLEPYAALRGFFAFYARECTTCWVGHKKVLPQEGDFYGGWITPQIVGPFKGGPGTMTW